MQLINKFKREFRFLSCATDILSKYAWVISLKDKRGIANTFQKVLEETNCKSNKIWVGKGCEPCNRSIKLWLETNAIEMYLTHNEGKSIVAERFIRNLNNKTYKYMASIAKMWIFIN